jgi:hypothetical protein
VRQIFAPERSASPFLAGRDGGDAQIAGANLGHSSQQTKCFFNNLLELPNSVYYFMVTWLYIIETGVDSV